MARALMLQGTGSNVGKSMLVAGLCRAFAQDGLRVAPFKPQNMSNNAAVTPRGGEIGRAQALQARAAGIPAHVDMNPVLLKPQSDTGAQVIVQGQLFAHQDAAGFGNLRNLLLGKVVESYARLATQADLILIEGAGSPAETNLRARDIANMGFAEAVNAPVALIGDIDRGGVIAQLVGTHTVLEQTDRARIKGVLVNKFRGDIALFDAGLADIVARTGWQSFGVIPWFGDAWRLPPEDMIDVATNQNGAIRVAVPMLSRAANLDDLDALGQEPDITLDIVTPGRAMPGDADLVLLTGTKSTTAELAFFRAQGWDIDLAAHIRRGGHVMGICGGYQMLGRSVSDPEGLEGPAGTVQGLGHLDVETVMQPEKQLREVAGIAAGHPVHGYEIHLGHTDGPDCARPFLTLGGRGAGAATQSGQVVGHYLHGIFSADRFRRTYFKQFGPLRGGLAFEATVEATLDALAAHLREHLDTGRLLAAAEPVLPEEFTLPDA